MKRQIEAVEQAMQRHAERYCQECKGTGRVKPSSYLEMATAIVIGGPLRSTVMCMKCFGSGYSVPPEQV